MKFYAALGARKSLGRWYLWLKCQWINLLHALAANCTIKKNICLSSFKIRMLISTFAVIACFYTVMWLVDWLHVCLWGRRSFPFRVRTDLAKSVVVSYKLFSLFFFFCFLFLSFSEALFNTYFQYEPFSLTICKQKPISYSNTPIAISHQDPERTILALFPSPSPSPRGWPVTRRWPLVAGGGAAVTPRQSVPVAGCVWCSRSVEGECWTPVLLW